MSAITNIYKIPKQIASNIPDWSIPLLMRVSIFFVFWTSVQTKISGERFLGQNFSFWNITDSTFTLFEYEYSIPFLPYQVATYLATFTEFFFALGLLLGFLTRISSIGLFLVTLVIQLFVYPDLWQVHLLWAAGLVYLVKTGPGIISLDHLIQELDKMNNS